ncbi:MAG: hypothetical protein M3434_10845 [Gemmatimonadota bacterium]|nr:hypothetical protein [Gemmatimonadota bacterium]
MRLVSEARERLRTILFRTQENREMDEELRFSSGAQEVFDEWRISHEHLLWPSITRM